MQTKAYKIKILSTPTVRGEMKIDVTPTRSVIISFIDYYEKIVKSGSYTPTCVMVRDELHVEPSPNHLELWKHGIQGLLKEKIPYSNVTILWASYLGQTPENTDIIIPPTRN